MTSTNQVIQPFLHGYIDPSMVSENILDGAFFSVVPRDGQVKFFFNWLWNSILRQHVVTSSA